MDLFLPEFLGLNSVLNSSFKFDSSNEFQTNRKNVILFFIRLLLIISHLFSYSKHVWAKIIKLSEFPLLEIKLFIILSETGDLSEQSILRLLLVLRFKVHHAHYNSHFKKFVILGFLKSSGLMYQQLLRLIQPDCISNGKQLINFQKLPAGEAVFLRF